MSHLIIDNSVADISPPQIFCKAYKQSKQLIRKEKHLSEFNAYCWGCVCQNTAGFFFLFQHSSALSKSNLEQKKYQYDRKQPRNNILNSTILPVKKCFLGSIILAESFSIVSSHYFIFVTVNSTHTRAVCQQNLTSASTYIQMLQISLRNKFSQIHTQAN